MTDDHITYAAFFASLAVVLALVTAPALSAGPQEKAHAVVWAWAVNLSDKAAVV